MTSDELCIEAIKTNSTVICPDWKTASVLRDKHSNPIRSFTSTFSQRDGLGDSCILTPQTLGMYVDKIQALQADVNRKYYEVTSLRCALEIAKAKIAKTIDRENRLKRALDRANKKIKEIEISSGEQNWRKCTYINEMFLSGAICLK